MVAVAMLVLVVTTSMMVPVEVLMVQGLLPPHMKVVVVVCHQQAQDQA